MTVSAIDSPLREDVTRSDLLNEIATKINAKSYLEIGVQTGATFHRVEVSEKVGVDPDPTSRASLHITSDFYFDILDENKKFDLIYVDGLHEWQTALRDIKNAVRHLSENGVIVVDDIAPKRESHQTRKPTHIYWTGDVWIAWLIATTDLREEFDLFSVDLAFGQGIIIPKKFGTSKQEKKVDQLPNSMNWKYYEQNHTQFHNMISFEEFKEIEW